MSEGVFLVVPDQHMLSYRALSLISGVLPEIQFTPVIPPFPSSSLILKSFTPVEKWQDSKTNTPLTVNVLPYVALFSFSVFVFIFYRTV